MVCSQTEPVAKSYHNADEDQHYVILKEDAHHYQSFGYRLAELPDVSHMSAMNDMLERDGCCHIGCTCMPSERPSDTYMSERLCRAFQKGLCILDLILVYSWTVAVMT
jgi:hypothetical protein